MSNITRKQQVENIIEWINRLPNFKKAVEMLGYKDKDGEWKYCCLGVACRVVALPRVDFEEGSDDRLIDKLCLRTRSAEFDRKVEIEVERPSGNIQLTVSSLVGSNDEVFGDDDSFANQRAFMILTTNRWIANKKVLEEVNKHFAKERADLAKTVKLQLLGKHEYYND